MIEQHCFSAHKKSRKEMGILIIFRISIILLINMCAMLKVLSFEHDAVIANC
jgi:uncharacterized membrane protein YkgB